MHEVFSLSSNVHAQNIGTKKLLLMKPNESFDTGILNTLKKVQHWTKENFLVEKRVFRKQLARTTGLCSFNSLQYILFNAIDEMEKSNITPFRRLSLML